MSKSPYEPRKTPRMVPYKGPVDERQAENRLKRPPVKVPVILITKADLNGLPITKGLRVFCGNDLLAATQDQFPEKTNGQT